MPLANREMVESIAVTCLENISAEGHGSTYCNHTTVKTSILRLGVSCISTPWSDGSASSIVSRMRRTASYLRFDRNFAVSSAAYTALTICNSLATPRAPPLVIVTRDKKIAAFGDGMSSSFSKAALEEGIDNVRDSILQNKDEPKQGDEIKIKKDANPSVVRTPAGIETTEKLPKVADKRNQEDENDASSTAAQRSESENVAVIPASHEESDSKEIHEEEELKQVQESEISQDDSTHWSNEELQTVNSKITSTNEGEEESDDEDFPMIVDCDPDDEDIE